MSDQLGILPTLAWRPGGPPPQSSRGISPLLVELTSLVILFAPLSAWAQATFQIVTSFEAESIDASHPYAGLTEATDGSLYGTTVLGGPDQAGTVFRIDAAGNRTTVTAFQMIGGTYPYGSIIQAGDGHFYGTTHLSGASGYGTVFRLDAGGERTTLHQFADRNPVAGLLEATDGLLYGTTSNGGTYGHGTIYSIETSGILTTLHGFNGTDGTSPYGGLVQGSDGEFYGATDRGGVADVGTVFRMDFTGTVTTLHSFSGADGARPYAGVTTMADGTIYGTTHEGGLANRGTVFKIDPAGAFTSIHSFSGEDGAYPYSTVIEGRDGALYGTTSEGGSGPDHSGYGTVYRIDGSGTITTLHRFTGADGEAPYGDLIEASDGNLYGTTYFGGPLGGGVVFRIKLAADLMISGVANPPSVAAPGSTFLATDTTVNQGNLGASVSRTRYYLSLDDLKSSNDLPLSPSRYVPSLAATEQSNGTITLKVSSSVAPGTYTLFACADGFAEIMEIDETNNCLAAATAITIVRPDLQQVSVSDPPATAIPGSKFIVTDTVRNPSPVSVLASSTRYYVSSDQLRDAGDVLLTGKRPVPKLLANTSNTGKLTIMVPSSTPDGSYYLLACADDTVKVIESDETNNCVASGTRVLVGWPDLVVTEVSDPPPTALVGRKFTVIDTVANLGTVAARAFSVRYYLSPDAVKSTSDLLLMGARSVLSLAAGATSTGTRSVTVPSTAPLGTYYVVACADDSNKVPESDNANNCRVSATTVLIQ
jgi:uncharacterized repeat protein (TIGR03803 family)